MEIPEKILKFKAYIFLATTISVAIFSLLYVAPRFLDLLAYFWPLLVSTAIFLAAAVVIGRTSPPAAETYSEKAGEEILDFVAGQVPEEVVPKPENKPEPKQSYKSEQNVM